jgi:hypothetical protein
MYHTTHTYTQMLIYTVTHIHALYTLHTLTLSCITHTQVCTPSCSLLSTLWHTRVVGSCRACLRSVSHPPPTPSCPGPLCFLPLLLGGCLGQTGAIPATLQTPGYSATVPSHLHKAQLPSPSSSAEKPLTLPEWQNMDHAPNIYPRPWMLDPTYWALQITPRHPRGLLHLHVHISGFAPGSLHKPPHLSDPLSFNRAFM